MSRTIGVGFVGAGPVVQAIHLPTLARLEGLFRTVSVTDVDPEVAAEVAARVGCRPVTEIEQLLADPAVEVVAVCSPQQFHAEHVEAACLAGKRAVFCEKPLAVSRSEVTRVAEVARRTGVPIVVGAMHAYDPGWTRALDAEGALLEGVHTVRSEIILPPNSLFEDWATELLARPAPTSPDTADPEVRAAMVEAGVLALAIHDLPLVRRFLGTLEEVELATFLEPFGYLLSLRGGDGRTADVIGALHGGRHTSWTFDAWGDRTWLHTDFTPSFVHAGSAVTTVGDDRARRRYGPFPANGYEQEWRALADPAPGTDVVSRYDLDTVLADIAFAADLAEAAAGLVRKEARS
jgi:predicted dehydrogenase